MSRMLSANETEQELLLLGIDVGTSEVKVVAVNAAGDTVRSAACAVSSTSWEPGFVEQQPEDWVRTSLAMALRLWGIWRGICGCVRMRGVGDLNPLLVARGTVFAACLSFSFLSYGYRERRPSSCGEGRSSSRPVIFPEPAKRGRYRAENRVRADHQQADADAETLTFFLGGRLRRQRKLCER